MKNAGIHNHIFFLFLLPLFMWACNPSGSKTEEMVNVSPPSDSTLLTIQIRRSEIFGDYLTDNKGRSLYLFMADSILKSTCNNDCITKRPPLIVGERILPDGGEGVNTSLISILKRQDGTFQVAYNGWPLYYFKEDHEKGDTNGHDATNPAGQWFLINPKGKEITKDQAASNSLSKI